MLGQRRRQLRLRSGLPCRICGDDGGELQLDIQERPAGGPYSSGAVWEGAELAADLFWERTQLRGVSVLELGSGTGVGGIAAACAGAQVVLTDLQDALPLIRENVELNDACINRGGGRVCRVLEIDLHSPDAGVETMRSEGLTANVVLLADVTYHAELVDAAVRTVRSVVLAAGDTARSVEVLVVHRPRGKVSDESLVEAFRQGGFRMLRCAATPWPDAHYFLFALDYHSSKSHGGHASDTDAKEGATAGVECAAGGGVMMAALMAMASGDIMCGETETAAAGGEK